VKIKRANTKPFWSLIILLFLDLVWRIALIITIIKLRQFAGNVNFTPIIVQLVISFAVLLAEAIVYWKLRRRFQNMSWVWTHVFLLYFILLVMPIAYLIGLPLLNRYFAPESYSELMVRLSWIRVIFFWSILAMAHLFFVLTIVKSYSTKNDSETEVNATSDLLDQP